MEFYLGIHDPAQMARTACPTFVSRRRLERQRSWPVPGGPWALDSGGFSELTMYGEWTIGARAYARLVRSYAEAMPGMTFAAPQDWMCEPSMLTRTGLTVARHQALTTANFLDLCDEAPDLPFIPVLQGQTLAEYQQHADDYCAAGVDMGRLFGLGSVCRRQRTTEIRGIVHGLADAGLRMHGFGMKETGLRLVGGRLASADSMAWSYQAWKRSVRLLSCTHRARDCRSCLAWALAWREKVMAAIEAGDDWTLDLWYSGS